MMTDLASQLSMAPEWRRSGRGNLTLLLRSRCVLTVMPRHTPRGVRWAWAINNGDKVRNRVSSVSWATEEQALEALCHEVIRQGAVSSPRGVA